MTDHAPTASTPARDAADETASDRTAVSPPCLVCGKALEDAFAADQDWNQPNDAVAFTANGNYGSTVFDPIDSLEALDINVCDTCLLTAAAQGRVQRVIRFRPVKELNRTLWTGPGGAH